jgi:hypothetical protein
MPSRRLFDYLTILACQNFDQPALKLTAPPERSSGAYCVYAKISLWRYGGFAKNAERPAPRKRDDPGYGDNQQKPETETRDSVKPALVVE